MKKILVIGGSYFAGRVFVENMAPRRDVKIHTFNRGNLPLNLEGVQEIRGDREKSTHISDRLPPTHYHAVVDFCGYTPRHISDLFYNFGGTIGQYIFISTTSIYEQSPDAVPIQEEAAKVSAMQPELGDFADYGFNKWKAECELERICQSRKIPVTVLRPAIIYGRYNYAPRDSYFFTPLLSDQPLILPTPAPARFSFIWVDDLARLIKDCIDRPTPGCIQYNIAAPETPGYEELAELMGAASERLPVIHRLPLSEIARKTIPLPFPPDTSLLYDGNRISRELGFTYTPLQKGMRRTWQYFLACAQHKKRRAGISAV